MSLPIYLHSGMANAPTLDNANGSVNAVLDACLVNGFNTRSVVSATAASGVVTFNFSADPGFSVKDPVTVAGASNALVNGARRVLSAANNQVLLNVPGVPDGPVGGAITLKFSPLGWTRPYNGMHLGAYRQGGSESHKRYLRVDDGTLSAGSGEFFARGYESMTGVSSGAVPFPDLAEKTGNGVSFWAPSSSPGARPWLVVGTGRSFYFALGVEPGAFTTTGTTGILFFGDFANIQKPGDAYAQALSEYSFPYGAIYGCRARSALVSPRPAQDLLAYAGTGNLNGGLTYPDPASGGFVVEGPAAIRETLGSEKCLRGFLPGVLRSLHQMDLPSGALFDNVVGVSGRLLYVASWATSYNGFFVALDEDWGNA